MSNRTNFYEITFILNPVLEDEQIKNEVDRFKETLSKNKAEVDEVDEWGTQKFAYEMDGKGSGYYVNAYFEAPSDSIENIERFLRINDNVMRFLTLKYDAKMLRHRELQKKNAVPNVFVQEGEEGTASADLPIEELPE